MATWCKEPTYCKRPWCWERLKAGGEGDDRRWDGWMASPTQWTWVWANSRRWWRTGKPGVLQSIGLQRVGHDWAMNKNNSIILGYNAAEFLPELRMFWLIKQKKQEDPLEEGMATHSSIIAWRTLWTEDPGGLPWPIGSQRVGHDWAT